MTQPKSIEEFNNLTERQKIEWIKSEAVGAAQPNSPEMLYYELYDLIIHFRRSDRNTVISYLATTIRDFNKFLYWSNSMEKMKNGFCKN